MIEEFRLRTCKTSNFASKFFTQESPNRAFPHQTQIDKDENHSVIHSATIQHHGTEIAKSRRGDICSINWVSLETNNFTR